MLADSSYAASCQISLVLASTVRHYLTLSATTLEMNCLVDRRRCLLGSAAEVSATYGTTMSRAACARRTAPDRENSTDRQHRDSTIVLHRLAFVVVFTALLLATAALGCCGCRSQDAEIYVMHTMVFENIDCCGCNSSSAMSFSYASFTSSTCWLCHIHA